MRDAEKYQRDFDDLMRETEAKAKRAELLQGVERLEQLFAKAAEVGIDQMNVWRIIAEADDDSDPKSGHRTLIEEIKKRTVHRSE